MLSKIKNQQIFSLIFILVIFFSISNLVNAKISDWNTKLKNTAESSSVYETIDSDTNSSEKMADYIGRVLLILPFLGILLIMQLVLAGYEWMTAGGNKEKVEKAQKRIRYAIIGVILFISVYMTAQFIVNHLGNISGYKIN